MIETMFINLRKLHRAQLNIELQKNPSDELRISQALLAIELEEQGRIEEARLRYEQCQHPIADCRRKILNKRFHPTVSPVALTAKSLATLLPTTLPATLPKTSPAALLPTTLPAALPKTLPAALPKTLPTPTQRSLVSIAKSHLSKPVKVSKKVEEYTKIILRGVYTYCYSKYFLDPNIKIQLNAIATSMGYEDPEFYYKYTRVKNKNYIFNTNPFQPMLTLKGLFKIQDGSIHIPTNTLLTTLLRSLYELNLTPEKPDNYQDLLATVLGVSVKQLEPLMKSLMELHYFDWPTVTAEGRKFANFKKYDFNKKADVENLSEMPQQVVLRFSSPASSPVALPQPVAPENSENRMRIHSLVN